MKATATTAVYFIASMTDFSLAFTAGGNLNLHTSLIDTKSTTFLHASVGLGEPPTVSVDNDLPPVLQHLVDERREYEINLGKAMDTLRKDYPMMLKQKPDFSIYHEDIQVTDPSGVQVKKLSGYKNSFRFLQAVVGMLYNTDRSTVQFRMVYDFARQSIRVSWNAMLVPKIVGNRRNSLYIDGISVYNMDAESGKIIEHRIENMLINNTPVQPPYGVLSALSQELIANRQQVPVGVGAMIEFQ